MSAAELLALAERCESAPGPDRGLDCAIYVALGLGALGRSIRDSAGHYIGTEGDEAVPDWTESLDACRFLHERALPGWGRDVDATMPEIGITVRVHTPFVPDKASGPEERWEADNRHEELAWLSAILKALAARLP